MSSFDGLLMVLSATRISLSASLSMGSIMNCM
jgi:hypothetical protein